MLTTYFVLILAIFIGGIVGAVLIFQAKKNIHFLYLRNFTFNKRSTEFIEKYFLEYSNLNCIFNTNFFRKICVSLF